MALTTLAASGGTILSPEEVQALVIKPLIAEAVATQVSGTVTTTSNQTRFPVVNTDPVAAWTPEEARRSNPSDADLDELVVTPKKLAGLSILSNELVDDSDPSALHVVGDGLVRDLRTRLDSAYFGTTVANGPDGIQNLRRCNPSDRRSRDGPGCVRRSHQQGGSCWAADHVAGWPTPTPYSA